MKLREIVAAIWQGLGPPDPTPAMAAPMEQADLIEVFKHDRQMTLKREGKVLKRYRIALGFAPERHKEREGDGRTPEGHYTIDARNRRSAFHLSLRISYPRERNKMHAASLNVPPGGDIYIHGMPNGWRKFATRHPRRDWTTGCIAVSDAEIREVWSRVPTGISVAIHP